MMFFFTREATVLLLLQTGPGRYSYPLLVIHREALHCDLTLNEVRVIRDAVPSQIVFCDSLIADQTYGLWSHITE